MVKSHDGKCGMSSYPFATRMSFLPHLCSGLWRVRGAEFEPTLLLQLPRLCQVNTEDGRG